MGTLHDEIRAWSRTLKPWQREAVRRLFQKPKGLTRSDYDDLLTLLTATEEVESPRPLDASDLAISSRSEVKVALGRIYNLRYVNRIANGQELEFLPSGLTVVYGENASGKSGYVRVLKKACRARDTSEEVLPDATQPESSNLTPSASFAIASDEIEEDVNWSVDGRPSDTLAGISVFDSRCARVYLNEENEVAYLPQGLDVLQRLADDVCPTLHDRLQEKIQAIDTDPTPFKYLVDETTVGRLVESLSHKSDSEELRHLALLTESDQDRLASLKNALNEPDPEAKATECRRAVLRLKSLSLRIEEAVKLVSADRVRELQECVDALESAKHARRIAATELEDVAHLKGVGSSTWKLMFDAARRYSLEEAYPETNFPHVKAGARCVLCQQPIDRASHLMTHFSKFVEREASKIEDRCRLKLESEVEELKKRSLDLQLGAALIEELESVDGTLGRQVERFQASLRARKDALLDAISANEWDAIPDLTSNPSKAIRSDAASKLCSARALARAANADERTNLQKAHDELDARRKLSLCVESVVALIERMRERRRLEAHRIDLDTRHISNKAKDLAETVVTEALRSAVQQELDNLRMRHVKVTLKERSKKGRLLHSLVLDLPAQYDASKILSEGEQRAIAIASFLAELRLSDSRGGIILDDPVSSLDHHRRRTVAERLTKEAQKRQVIIFTHDTTFLGELRDAAEQHDVKSQVCFLEWREGRPGYVVDGLPREHQRYKERLDDLRKRQSGLKKLPWTTYPNSQQKDEIRRAYGELRATIEVVVQDLVLNGTVRRYRDWIRVKNLEKVVGLQRSEYEQIYKLYDKCSDVIEGHATPSDKLAGVPSAIELGEDVDALDLVIETIKSRRRT